ncbi:hypothetical protein NQ176_g64 [Zarea fungicola]|uniref:Uncharacterized protein n=1 Tax=Zarea fungicola TaxID=93591 RepID=A0ACC1NZI6_9HYPO|nr:hypothetical protein NQ176_g64 [Lecanicillium fungicola]
MGLAALHQRSLLGETEGHQLEIELHTEALRQLQDFLALSNTDELQSKNETLVEIMTCGIALISFEVSGATDHNKSIEVSSKYAEVEEVLKGSTSNWQPHLCAMASIASTIYDRVHHTKSPPQFPPPLFDSKATAAAAFHIPVLLWMDILACVATGHQPKLPYAEWLSPKCKFELVNLMGCRNSVMKAIGDLGAFSKCIVEALALGNVNLKRLWEERQRIEDELEDIIEATPTHLVQV